MMKANALLFLFAIVTTCQANLYRQPITRSNVQEDYPTGYQNAPQPYPINRLSNGEPVVVDPQERFGGFGHAHAGAGAGGYLGGHLGGHVGGHIGGHLGGHLGGHVGGHVGASAAAAAAAGAGGGFGGRYVPYGGGYGGGYGGYGR